MIVAALQNTSGRYAAVRSMIHQHSALLDPADAAYLDAETAPWQK
jgi:hypothetical protein